MAIQGIVEVLGGEAVMGSEPASASEWVERIRTGLPFTSAIALKQAIGLTNAELAAVLGISARSLARLDPTKGRLDAVGGDRLVRTARLYSIAADVLEERKAAARWLKSPQRALGGAVPLELAGTDVGGRAVEALLGRMEHGVYA